MEKTPPAIEQTDRAKPREHESVHPSHGWFPVNLTVRTDLATGLATMC